MWQAISKIAKRLLRQSVSLARVLPTAFHRAGSQFYRVLAHGHDLERTTLAEIRVVGARLRRQRPAIPAQANPAPHQAAALTSSARQALKPSLKGGARLKNEI